MNIWNVVAGITVVVSIAAQAVADPPQGVTSTGPGPAWTSYKNLYDGKRFDVGGFPINYELFGNTYAVTQTLVGTLNIPSTAVGGAAGSGVAGYALSASPSQGAVGIFGFGGSNADGVSTWGGNVIAQNCPGASSCATNTGHSGNVWGFEIDLNIFKEGGAAPMMNERGLSIIGASEVNAVGGVVAGIDIDSPGIGQRPRLKWNDAIRVEDGSAVDVYLGAIGQSGVNNVGSIPLLFNSRDSGGGAHTAVIAADARGDLVLMGASGAAGVISSSGNCGLAALPATDAAGCPLLVTGSVSASTFIHVTPTTVSGLATADPSPSLGDLAIVSDAAACAFGSAVTGGGSTKCPVYYDGAWKAG